MDGRAPDRARRCCRRRAVRWPSVDRGRSAGDARRRRWSTGSAPGCRTCSRSSPRREPLSLQVHPTRRRRRPGSPPRQPAGARCATTSTRTTSRSCWSRSTSSTRCAGSATRRDRPTMLAALRRAGAGPGRRARCAPATLTAPAARARSSCCCGWPAPDRAGAGRRGRPRAGRCRSAARPRPQRYPGDLGVVVALLLNHVRLRPGRGGLHAGRQPARLPERRRAWRSWRRATTCCGAG